MKNSWIHLNINMKLEFNKCINVVNEHVKQTLNTTNSIRVGSDRIDSKVLFRSDLGFLGWIYIVGIPFRKEKFFEMHIVKRQNFCLNGFHPDRHSDGRVDKRNEDGRTDWVLGFCYYKPTLFFISFRSGYRMDGCWIPCQGIYDQVI